MDSEKLHGLILKEEVRTEIESVYRHPQTESQDEPIGPEFNVESLHRHGNDDHRSNVEDECDRPCLRFPISLQFLSLLPHLGRGAADCLPLSAFEKYTMPEDIGEILDSWPFDGQNNVRKVVDATGAEKIQIRIEQGAFQGILQMDLDGRPDGRRPYDQEFVLDHFQEKLAGHQSSDGAGEKFRLSRKDCREIFDESFKVYERYVFLLQVKDYKRVIRDTERNMEVFGFVKKHGAHREDRLHLERWWPYVLRIHCVARVLVEMQENNHDSALGIIREAENRIENLEEVDAEEFHTEKERSREALKELTQEVIEKKPLNRKETLQRALEEAVKQEEYEKAAVLRDQLKGLD